MAETGDPRPSRTRGEVAALGNLLTRHPGDDERAIHGPSAAAVMPGALASRALSYLLAAAIAGALVVWVGSGAALEQLRVDRQGDQAQRASPKRQDRSPKEGRRRGEPPAERGRPFEGARSTARDVGDTALSTARVVLASVLALASVLLVTRTLARRRRRYRRFRIVPHRGSEAGPERVQQLLESWHQQLLPRWWRRVVFGQASVALEAHASETTGTDGRIELLVQCPARAVRALEGTLHACYPDARLVEIEGERERPRRVIRLKKRFDFILRLRTAGDAGGGLMDAALTQMAALERPLTLQYVLTPAPAVFERLSRLLFRASEARLERARLRDRGDPGLRSGVAAQELKGGLAVQHRRLFFAEVRVGGPSYAACRALAGALRGESAAENQLVERYMRPYASGPLHARRMRRGLADPLPSWRRGVLSSSELAALWQLPGPALRLPGLERSPLPRAPAPTGVSRAHEHALLRDERGPVGIRPGDRTAGLGLIGGQGTGKTAAMCRTVASDARDPDCALIVLDPKSDLADKALSMIPPQRTVHYLDFEAPEIGINPLIAPGDPAMVADKVVEAFKDIHEDGDIRASSDRFLRQAAHAAIGASRLGAIEEEPNLWHMYRLLLPSEEEFRERIVRAIEPKASFVETAIFFGRDLPDDLRAAPALTTGKLTAPRNKILRLLVESLDKVLRHPIQLSLDEVIRRREALVVDGRMGTFGAGNCRVMMQFILALVYGALQRQQQLPEGERARVALKVDEAHLILNESFANALATLRSAGLEVVAAWQYGEQIQDRKIRGGMLSLLRQRSIFSLGEADDARELADVAMDLYTDVIRADRETRANVRFGPDTLFNLPNHHAVCSWLSGGERVPAFVAETYPLHADSPLIAHHRRAQRERGAGVPAELAHPFGDIPPLDRVPPTGRPTPKGEADDDAALADSSVAVQEKAPVNSDGAPTGEPRDGDGAGGDGARPWPELRRDEHTRPAPDDLDDARLGTTRGAPSRFGWTWD